MFRRNRLVTTRNLNQAAFLTTLGAKLVSIGSTYPHNVFTIKAHPLHLFFEKKIGFVPYRRFCTQRVQLKERSRKMSGLPKHFTGREEGFNFGEIAQVREFSKKEKSNLSLVDKE